MKKKTHAKEGAAQRALEGWAWLRIEQGRVGPVELPKPLPTIRF